jgi:uncharacterized protein (DUF983 family)
MRTCQSCGRVRFYSLNFIFAKDTCNECYLAMKERQQRQAGSNNDKKRH